MFRNATYFSILGFGVSALAWLFQFGIVRQSDIDLYYSFLEKDQIAPAFASTTHQMRQGVRKDIWFAQEDGSRLHYRIQSESSLLTLVPDKKKVEVIENLEKIKCWMQDKLYEGANAAKMQQIRFFEADQGTYQYTTQKFLAQTVELSLFRLADHILPQTLDPKTSFLKGIAKDVSFSVSGKLPHFQAQQFKAILKQQKEG